MVLPKRSMGSIINYKQKTNKMKKVFLVLAIFSVLITQAQNGFIITDNVSVSVGGERDSVYVEARANGIGADSVLFSLPTWESLDDKTNRKDRIYLEVNGKKIESIKIALDYSDTLVDMINKVKAKLTTLYGWNIE